MRQRVLPRFVEERSRFALRFTCEYCSHFDEERERCTHGYPNAEHRAARYEDRESELLFCKDFDLV